jgi:hypothetical protein
MRCVNDSLRIRRCGASTVPPSPPPTSANTNTEKPRLSRFQCSFTAGETRVATRMQLQAALAHVHDRRARSTQNTIFGFEKATNRLGQREQARVALQQETTSELRRHKGTPMQHWQAPCAASAPESMTTHLAVILRETRVDVSESRRDGGVDEGGGGGDARCFVAVFASLERTSGDKDRRKDKNIFLVPKRSPTRARRPEYRPRKGKRGGTRCAASRTCEIIRPLSSSQYE